MNDIVKPLENGMHKLVWPLAIELTRGGNKPLQTAAGTEDRWRVQVLCRSSLCLADGTCILNGGAEIEMVEPAVGQDIADIIHDADVQALVPLLRRVALRLISGDLKPLPVPLEVEAPAEPGLEGEAPAEPGLEGEAPAEPLPDPVEDP
jgi:hypothetical protein